MSIVRPMPRILIPIEHLVARVSVGAMHLSLLVLAAASLDLYAITWGLPNVGDWANLSLAPVKPLSFAKHLLYREPWYFHYPPFHFMVLAIVEGPYVLYLLLTGGLHAPTDAYPYGLADPLTSLTVFTLLARLVSVCMGVGLVVINYLTVRRFHGATAGFISSFLIATAYPIVHFSHNANVDVPYLFWLSLALYSVVRLIEGAELRWYLLLALFTAFAIGTKHTAFALAAGLVPTVLYVHYRSVAARRPGGDVLRAFVDRRLVYASLLFAVVLTAIFDPVLNWQGFAAHIARHERVSVATSWVIREAPSVLRGHEELVMRYLDYIRQINGLPAFLLIAAGVVYCLVRLPTRSLIVMLPIVTYYLLFLTIFGTHHLRYVLPIYVLCTWQAGRLAADLASSSALPRLVPRLALALILGYSLLYGSTVDVLYARDPRYAAEAWIGTHVPRTARVLAVEPDYSLPRFPEGLAVTYRNLWDFNGTQLADITDVGADYVVVGMSIPRRSHHEHWTVPWVHDVDVESFLTARGYRRVASFQTPVPVWGAAVPDIHVINPRVAIWQTRDDHRPFDARTLRSGR